MGKYADYAQGADDEISSLEGQLSSALDSNTELRRENTQLANQVQELSDALAECQGGGTPDTWTPAFSADVKPDTIRWGTSKTDNLPADSWGARRRYYQEMTDKEITGLLNDIKEDHLDNILPVVSIKPGTTWKNFKVTAPFTKLCQGMAATGKPIVFALNHEPFNMKGEGDSGSAADFMAMSRTARGELDKAKAKNVTYVVNHQSSFIGKASSLLADSVWDASVFNAFTVDGYNPNGSMSEYAWIEQVKSFCKRNKITKLAYLEWGITDAAPNAGAAMIDSHNFWRERLLKSDGIHVWMACYWNSQVSAADPDYKLTGARLDAWKAVAALKTSVFL